VLIITTAELIISTVPLNPYIKLLAMVNPSMLASICVCVLILDALYLTGVKAPMRISSIAKGELVRPGLYTLFEDVIGASGTQNSDFRAKLNRRWQASHEFRRLILRLSLFWSVPGLVVSATCMAIIFSIDLKVGFAIVWIVPFLWAVVWVLITFLLVRRSLKREKLEWVTRSNAG
jgi:hypothetical protein